MEAQASKRVGGHAAKRGTTPLWSVLGGGVPRGDVIPGSAGPSHLGRPAVQQGEGSKEYELPIKAKKWE